MQTTATLRRRPPRLPVRHRLSWKGAWHDLGVRSWIYQAIVLIGVIALGSFLVGNAQDALSKQGISTGFAFLADDAGFEIGERSIAFQSTDSFLKAYGVALLNTLKVSVASIVFATLIGVIVGVGRLSSNLMWRKFASIYVEVFRNTPQLVQLIFWYTIITKLPHPRQAFSFDGLAFLSNRGIVIPWLTNDSVIWMLLAAILASSILLWAILQVIDRRRKKSGQKQPVALMLGLMIAFSPIVLTVLLGPSYEISIPVLRGFNYQGGTTISPEFLALLLGLSLYIGAFIAEIVRSGIESVSAGQIEAAQTVGLGPFNIYRRVVFPQALRVMVPPAAGQYVSIVKNSSLGVAVGYPELFSVNNTIVTLSGHTIEAIAIMMSIYLAISFSIAIIMNLYNHKVQIKER
ncbi:ABC transporter permease subunit [Pollutimonas bauzanensis]|uniref:amino acid ABC transporter permease n=1 Tax=Pollutimonas bauzanensis TaxID=658167 RepID=UPI00333F881E